MIEVIRQEQGHGYDDKYIVYIVDELGELSTEIEDITEELADEIKQLQAKVKELEEEKELLIKSVCDIAHEKFNDDSTETRKYITKRLSEKRSYFLENDELEKMKGGKK